MRLNAIIEKGKDGYGVYVTNLQEHGLNGIGTSVEAAKTDMMEALILMTNMYTEEGKPIPEELVDPVFDYKYDIPSFFEDFDYLIVSKVAKRAGINASLLRQYKTKKAFASEEQTKKIEKAIHELGKEMMAVEFK
ncbi:pilus assembly protein HicB [Dysgonomonas sp. OttesenSCG-928-M03]|nr:pilus assembly protein HicB [Dysgonomonas sp. OttesenSCG-928-M03]